MRTDFTDDEEDLEALRLAALSSLKKKIESVEFCHNQHYHHEKHHNFSKGSFRGGKRRFFPGQTGRSNRNGQFNNQVRNSNLICISTSTDVSDTPQSAQKTSLFINKDEGVPKLIRPQDRYANKTDHEVESEGHASKFDRYDNSNSESDEEDEVSSAKLERTDSLEALMEELDAEIQGESRKEKKDKVKMKKEDKMIDDVGKQLPEDQTGNKVEISESIKIDVDVSNSQVIVHDTDELKRTSDILVNPKSSVNVDVREEKLPSVELPISKPLNHRSPTQNKTVNRRLNGRIFSPEPTFIPSSTNVLVPTPNFLNPAPNPQFTPVYNAVPSFTGPDVFPMNVPPPSFIPSLGIPPPMLPLDIPSTGFNAVPLRPLMIETMPPLSSIPMGPLSPRSAAFVLQNRAIVEKRRRSPRRSFSRSPSPPTHRARYSKSPPSRRSLSPLRRSVTPLRRSFSPSRRSFSPRRSPIRRSLSPYRRHRENSPRRSPRRIKDSPKKSPNSNRESPKRSRESRRTPVKDRLGLRNKNEEEDVEEKDVTLLTSTTKEDPKLDPVLEARKKKFESKEIKVKEGVIRLKPKESRVPTETEDQMSTKAQKEQKKESLSSLDQVRHNIKEVLSDKQVVKEEASTRIVLLPKNEEKSKSSTQPDQLEEAMNELEMLLKDEEALELTAKVDDLFTDEETDQENDGRFKVKMANLKGEKSFVSSGQQPMNGSLEKIAEKKNDTKIKWNFDEKKKESKLQKIKKEPLTNPIENRKIEIKIRNPAKYEKNSGKLPISNQVSSVRKVELSKKEVLSDEESEPEIVVDNENDEVEVENATTGRDGDLRAQLSRKRAERQNKLPTVEGVQSRLLQNALEGAIFKKKKSKKKEKESRDVKLPIHLRLGIAHDSEIFAEAATEKISRKKSKKRKHAVMEQV